MKHTYSLGGLWRQAWLLVLLALVAPRAWAQTATTIYYTRGSSTATLDALASVAAAGGTGTALAAGASNFSQPTDLVLDRTGGYLYVADQYVGTGGIYRYTTAGTGRTLVVAGVAGTTYNGLAFDATTNRLYFTQAGAATANAALKVVSLGGTLPATATSVATLPATFTRPGDVVFDATAGASALYVADQHTSGSIIKVLLSSGAITTVVPGTANATYNGLALDAANGRLYFTQGSTTATLDALKVLTLSNSTVTTLVSGSANFSQPSDLAFEPGTPGSAGQLYLTDQYVATGPLLRYTLGVSGGVVSAGTRTALVAATAGATYGGLALALTNPTATPVVTAPANGSLQNTTTPIYSGTAVAGSTVTVYVDGTSIGTTTATGGTFNLTQPTALAQGSHTVYATALASGLTVSANSNTNTFTVDSVRPTVAITSTVGASGSTTSTSPIPFTVTFSEAVTGFVAGDVTVGNGTITGGVVNGASPGITFTFTVTPTTAGTATTVNVPANVAVDAATNGNTAAPAPYSLTFTGPTIVVNPTSLSNGTVATAYSQTITAAGGTAPYTFAITAGALPAGLTLTSAGTLSGTPTTGGTFNFTVRATDASVAPGPYSGTRSYSLTVASPTITLTPAALPTGTVASAYSQAITAAGGTAPYTYAITAGALPAGLTLTSAGTLSGTPTANGTFGFTVTATDASGGTGPYTGSRSYSLVISSQPVTAAPVITSPANGSVTNQSVTISGTAPAGSAVTVYVSQNGGAFQDIGTFTATGGTFSTPAFPFPSSTYQTYATAQSPGAAVSVNSGIITFTVDTDRPTVAISSTAGISGSITATIPIPFTVTFSENVTGFVAGDVTVTNGTIGTVSGSGATYAFNVTPTTAGTATTVNVPANVAVDAAGNGNTAAPAAYSLTFVPSAITIAPASLPGGTVGAAYSQTVTASGGTAPYAYAITVGALPAGLTLTSAGTLAGTPTASGTFNFTVRATDSAPAPGPFNGTRGYSLVIAAPAIVVAPATLPTGTVASAYSQTLTASGGTAPYTYAITAGALPAGLTLTSAGTLSGTPTANGTFGFTVMATDASGGTGPYTGSRSYSLVISSQPVTAAPVITSPANGSVTNQSVTISGTAPAGSAVTVYVSQNGGAFQDIGTFTATGGTFSTPAFPFPSSTYQTYATAQSPGAAVSVNSGIITFTVDTDRPTVAISSTAGISGSITATIPIPFTVTFSENVTGFVAGDVTVTNGTIGTVSGSGATYAFNVTPTTAGTATTVNVPANVAVDAAGNGNTAAPAAYSLTFVPSAITIAPASLPGGTVGAAYSQTVTASGGTAPYAYAITVGALPAGLTLTSAGTLAGTPTASGTFNFTVRATDSAPAPGPFNGTRGYSLVIAAPAIVVAPATLPTGTVASAYSQTLTASGGTAPYTYAITAGALPAGLTLTSAGTLSGTPTANGTFGFTVMATDASGGTGPYTGSRSYSLVISSQPVTAAPVITSPANGSVTNQSVTISGTAPAGSAVEVYVSQNGAAFQNLGTFTATGGTFSTPAFPFPSSTYQTYATAQSPGAAVSVNSGIITFTIDQNRPSVAITSAGNTSGGTTNTSPIPFTVTFSENVTGFVAGDVTVSNGTITGGIVNGSGTTYTFTVTPNTAGAVTTVNVPANVAQDAAGNGNTGATQYSITYSQLVTAAPVITSPTDGQLFNTTTPTYQGTAVANATVTVFVDGTAIGTTTATGGSFSLTQPTALAQGSHTVRATAQVSGSAVSANSNTNNFTVDTVNPTVVIGSTATSPTSTSPIPVRVTFSESVTGFGATGVTVTNGTLSGFGGSGSIYTFSVTPTSDGTVTVNVAANVAQDAAGNGNVAATFSIQYAAPITATIWTGNVSTDWFTAGNWTSGVPTATVDATIPANAPRYPVLAADAAAKNLSLNSGATLTQTNGTLTLNANLTNNGTYTATGGTVALGTSTQANLLGSSSTRFWNLTVQSNGVLLGTSAGASVQRVATLNGAFATQANPFTLESNATNTAMLVNNSSNVVNGDVTVQRYISPALNASLGYRHFSSPISTGTVASLATARFTPVVNPAYNTLAVPGQARPFPTVFGYDQSRIATVTNSLPSFDKGWFSPSTLSDALTVGQGYAVNLAANQTFSLTGAQNNGDVVLNLARNSGPTAAESGLALVGNPYPSPLNWQQVAATDRPGLDGVIYTFSSNDPTNPYAGTYGFYNNGIGTISPVLPLGQGFFVRVTQGQTGATLTLNNSHRPTSYTSPTYQRTAETRPLVHLTLKGAGNTLNDDAFVYFEQGSSEGFDPQYDAVKLPNPNGLNLSTSIAGQQFSIDGRPELGSAQRVIPLAVGVPAPGSYALASAELANLAATPVYLRDLQLGTVIDLRLTPSYQFTVANSSALLTGRFELVFSPQQVLATVPTALAQQVALYPNPAKKAAFVELPASLGRQAVTATLVDALGRQVRTVQLPAQGSVAHPLDLSELATGVYALRLSTSAGVVVKKLVIE